MPEPAAGEVTVLDGEGGRVVREADIGGEGATRGEAAAGGRLYEVRRRAGYELGAGVGVEPGHARQ